MKLTPTAFDSHTLNDGSYDAYFDIGNRPVTIQTVAIGRRNSWSLIDSISRDGFTILMHIVRNPAAAVTSAAFAKNVKQWFEPGAGVSGLRYLNVTGDDGSTALRIGVHVMSCTPSAEFVDAVDVVLAAPRPYFEASTATTSGSNPSSVTNAGNVTVRPTLTLTTTTHVTRQRWTVTGAGIQGGLRQYPVKLAIADANLTSANAYVQVNGMPVPFLVVGGGSSGSYIWLRVDTASDGMTATTVDVVYGSGISGNALAQTLPYGGMDLTDATCTNTTWKWNSLNTSGNPAWPACWRPAVTGGTGGVSGSFGMTAETASSVVLARYTDSTGPSDADSIVMETGGVTAVQLFNVSRVTAGHAAPTVTIATTVPGVASPPESAANEQQTITLANVTGGTFTLSWLGRTTNPIAYNAGTADIQTALEAVIGIGNVTVTGGPLPSGTITVEFKGVYANTNVASMSGSAGGLTGSGARSYIKSKQVSGTRDSYEWSSTTDATVTSAVAMNANTVQIAIGTEYTTSTPQNGSTLTLAKASGNDWALTLSETPTVALASTDTIDLYTGVITIDGRTITLTQLMVDDGTLTISEGDAGWTITSSATGAQFYGPRNRIAFSDADQWVTLAAGANSVAHTLTGATLVVSHRGGWL